jgi:ABC-type transporter Mla subunit MlaD
MADNGSTGFLGFILGGVVVVLAIVAFVVYGGSLTGGSSKTVNVDVNLPSAAKK